MFFESVGTSFAATSQCFRLKVYFRNFAVSTNQIIFESLILITVSIQNFLDAALGAAVLSENMADLILKEERDLIAVGGNSVE